jgi:hypothetical protein
MVEAYEEAGLEGDIAGKGKIGFHPAITPAISLALRLTELLPVLWTRSLS